MEKVATESQEQINFVAWFRLQFKKHRILSIPNGMWTKGIRTAIKAKKEGMSAGVPDLFIPSLILWVEMKRSKGGRLSPEQKDWISYLETCGHTVIIGNGFLDAKEKVLEFIGKKIQ